MTSMIFKSFAKKFVKMKCRPKCKSETILLLATIVSVIFGIITGIGLKYGLNTPMTPREIVYLNFPGELFVRMLKLLILPLMFSSLINSLANLDTTTASRLGLFAGLYYLVTIILAVATGIILVLAIKPGSYSRHTGEVKDVKVCQGTLPADTILDLFRFVFYISNIKINRFIFCFAIFKLCNIKALSYIFLEAFSQIILSKQLFVLLQLVSSSKLEPTTIQKKLF